MNISQGTAKISIVLNIVLTLFCFGLLIYALMQKTMAEMMAEEAIIQTEVAVQQRDKADSIAVVAIQQKEMAERARMRSDSAAMEALRQYERAQEARKNNE